MPVHTTAPPWNSTVSATPCTWSRAAWRLCTEREVLIDLAEWAAANDCEPLTSHRCALTAELWTLVESVPLAEISTPLALRLRPLIRAAQRALDRLLDGVPEGPDAPGATADFPFPLRCRGAHPGHGLLRLHAEQSEGQLFVTIGLCGEFGAHPLARPAS